MYLTQIEIPTAEAPQLLAAAEAAARAIPPAFPLSATVAVNPFLGQMGDDLPTAAARLGRVAGARLTRPRAALAAEVRAGRITDADLEQALAASSSALKPAGLAGLKAALGREAPEPVALPTVAELAADATGIDWPAVIARSIGLWAAGHFDRGQALWSPAPGRSAFAAWRDWAAHDLTPEIAGLSGFCSHVASAPDTPERAILRAADRLGLSAGPAEAAFHRLLVDLGGWAMHARWLLWEAELKAGTDSSITDLLAIRVIFEEALLAHVPGVAVAWADTVATYAASLQPTEDHVIDAILQEAAERAHQRRLIASLGAPAAPAAATRPSLQAAFCIDVRSEVFRRALESLDPTVETIGFAGFFGLPIAHRPHGTDQLEAHLPVLLNAAVTSTSHLPPAEEQSARIRARTTRAWSRFRQAAVSSFAFVEAAGPGYAWKLVKDSLGIGNGVASPEPRPVFEGVTAEAKAATAAAVLKAMSMTTGLAPLVVLLGHGAEMTNNPHKSAYQCGACGGHDGEVSARLLAQLLNDPEARAGLPAHGVTVPQDTFFLAGLHDTTADAIHLYEDMPTGSHAAAIAAARSLFDRAGALARMERAARLPGATGANVAARAANWAEIRPEWGLAGCAAFIAAPRSVTSRADLAGRAFLHNYDWQADEGFGTLELIITAPVVVASWISLQYYGSSVSPDQFGGGNKLIHNVVGGLGVVEGNGGMLRAGLPWQTVHDGEQLMHEPLRLSVMVEAPRDAILAVLEKHAGVRALFDNGWLHLFVLDGGSVTGRYRPGLVWEELINRK
jgi:uncharacterized protein YbcC (UPF0753/DUF2309 family)